MLTVILTMSGCQSTPVYDAEYDDPERWASQATAAGDTPRAARLHLRSATAYLAQGDLASAQAQLLEIDPERLTVQDRDQFWRLTARSRLEQEDTDGAEAALQSIQSREATDYLLLAEVCTSRNAFQCAADGYIQATLSLGMDHADLPENVHDLIWDLLSRAGQGPVAFVHRHHQAWWRLQQDMRNAGAITAQIAAWQEWRRRYPSHPAAIRPPRALESLENYTVPTIGMLVPLSGSLANAGRAVRDGFIAAYLEEGGTGRSPVRFYDAAGSPLGTIWEQALADGVEVLVGPLVKSQVEAFADMTRYSGVPRLLLNYTPEETSRDEKQFEIGIAIEDEASSLAQYVLEAGYKRVVIIHSNAQWSVRALDGFRAQWPFPTEAAQFEDIKNLTEAVGTAMHVGQSEARKNDLASILGQPLEFLPRARGDLEAIVALTSNVESRALVPALRFHFGDHLPVFATSQAARLGPLDELAGFRLSEMPIFTESTISYQQLNDAFATRGNPFAELYALGYDAYRVATWLPILDARDMKSLPGATGRLRLQGNGRFQRSLNLAQVSRTGELVLD